MEAGAGRRGLSPEHFTVLATAATLVCVTILAIVLFFVWATIVLVDSHAAAASACSGEAPVWVFCFLATSLLAVQLATGGGRDTEGNIHWLGYLFLACAVSLAVWGAGLWAGMGEACRDDMEGSLPYLMVLFRVCCVLVVVQAVLIVCMALFGAVLMGWAVVTWAKADEARRLLESGGEYEPVPDEVEGVARGGGRTTTV